MTRTADATPTIDLTVEPPRARSASAPEALAVPWASRLLPMPAGSPVSFGSMAVTGPGQALSTQHLVCPWTGVALEAPASTAVDFGSLAASYPPVLPSQRPGRAQPPAPIAE